MPTPQVLEKDPRVHLAQDPFRCGQRDGNLQLRPWRRVPMQSCTKRNLRGAHLELVYLVTALVPSDTACLASSPGSSRRTAVWISLEVMVERLLREASPAMRSKMSLTKEFMMPMALEEMPVSGCTCLSTLYTYTE
ncbi:hypothetical protein AAY473_007039 [Plecturocebus cupreus]